jgi:hypothetical protein
MGRNDGVDVRKERIQKVIQMIMAMFNANKNINEFQLDLVLADIEYETGLTEKRVLEYLSIGERRGLFIIDRKNNRIKRELKADSDGN